ncbi:MAG: hypothetical protein LBT50_11240 [Prevotellaceae bacterium]|jgi:hypothetical protein|nr:hypothetical protein [Prevotellaceae bacterium]
MKQLLTIIFSICFAAFPAQAQENNLLAEKIYTQLEFFPQEKIHIHTDKSVYVSGENIWYRAFVVNALLHAPSYASRYVYVELIAPSGELISRDKIRPDNDSIFHNNIDLAEDLAEGTYLIRAYTNFMRNRPEYFFEKKVFVADPGTSKVKVVPLFTSGEKHRTISLNFRNGKGENVNVKNLNMRTDTGVWKTMDAGEKFSFKTREKQQFIFAEFESDDRKHKRYFPVPPPANDFDVSFFPEGGYLIAGEICKVGFKAIKTNGLSEDITGEIVSDKGDTVRNIKSEHAGMGFFSILPEKGKKYYAVCTNRQGSEKRFQLPETNPEACALKVLRTKDKMYITVLKSSGFKERPLNLVVHVRGAVIYGGEWPEQNTLAIEKDLIPSGVIQILLLDGEMNPLSERAIFYFNNKELAKIDFSTDKQIYRTREKVSALAQITTETGDALNGSFSVSVTDDGDVTPDSLFSIVSDLLLCSDIRGYVESPAYYVQNPNNADILMLTQAWKRYNIPSVLKGDVEKPVHFLEAGQEISGKVEKMIGRKANENNTVTFIAPDGYVNTTQTDKDGRFVFNGFEYPDSTMFIVQALSKNKLAKSYVELVMDEETFPETASFTTPEYEQDSLLEKYVVKSDQKYITEYGTRALLLDAITITGNKRTSKYSSPTSTIIIPSEYKHIKGLDVTRAIRLFPRLYAYGGYLRIDIRGQTYSPIFIIDDWILDDTTLRIQDFDLDINDIASMEFLDPEYDGSLQMLPVAAPGGALIINTKSGTWGKGRKIKFNIKAWWPKGYRKAAEFYSPKYETGEDMKKGLDQRTTIFWKPNVVLKDGKAQFDFYTADYKTTYSVIIEGVTSEGYIIRKTERISLKGK